MIYLEYCITGGGGGGEIHGSYSPPIISRIVKSCRIQSDGHTDKKAETRNTYTIWGKTCWKTKKETVR
jgi:hypothetical protein